MIFSLIFAACLLTVIVAFMEDGEEIPDWQVLTGCVAAALFPYAICALLFGFPISLIGLIIGTLACGAILSLVTGMSVLRAFIASIIYFILMLGIEIAISVYGTMGDQNLGDQ